MRLPPSFTKHLAGPSYAPATFDPFTLMIHFVTDEPIPREEGRVREFVSKQPVSILAHELTHFFQMTATAYGVRRFGVFIEELQTKLNLDSFRELVKTHDMAREFGAFDQIGKIENLAARIDGWLPSLWRVRRD